MLHRRKFKSLSNNLSLISQYEVWRKKTQATYFSHSVTIPKIRVLCWWLFLMSNILVHLEISLGKNWEWIIGPAKCPRLQNSSFLMHESLWLFSFGLHMAELFCFYPGTAWNMAPLQAHSFVPLASKVHLFPNITSFKYSMNRIIISALKGTFITATSSSVAFLTIKTIVVKGILIVDVEKAVRWVQQEWAHLKPYTIINCWRYCFSFQQFSFHTLSSITASIMTVQISDANEHSVLYSCEAIQIFLNSLGKDDVF